MVWWEGGEGADPGEGRESIACTHPPLLPSVGGNQPLPADGQSARNTSDTPTEEFLQANLEFSRHLAKEKGLPWWTGPRRQQGVGSLGGDSLWGHQGSLGMALPAWCALIPTTGW